ncbi:DinB family protein [Lysobacter fragariae]
MNDATLQALADFPRLLAAHYAAVPAGFAHWAPASWEGIPSEHFTPIEQLAHVRDIEIIGYQVRIDRTLREDCPLLADIDSYALAAQRGYATNTDATRALEEFSVARQHTVRRLATLSDEALSRRAIFDGVGPVTVRGLIHHLCSHDQQHLAGLQWLLARIDAARLEGVRPEGARMKGARMDATHIEPARTEAAHTEEARIKAT